MSAAVVTGAGRGLGLEVARAVAARGLAVNVTDVDAAAADSAAAEIGGAAWGSTLDVRDLRRSGSRDVWISAVCPDGIWTPMLHDKLDDPDAAPSFSGVLLRPRHVAARTVELLDRPRAVLTIRRWRGGFVRPFDAYPGLAVRLLPLWMRDAQHRQRRWKKRSEGGGGP